MGKLKTYNEITGYAKIARRYFVNNFYDGILTVLGILLGFLVIILKNPSHTIPSYFIILTGTGTSISMLFSGISGSYLSERAEQKKEQIELEHAMGIHVKTEEYVIDEKEIQKAMVVPPKKFNDNIKKRRSIKNKKKKKPKTLHEKAETFTSTVVACVNGISPFLGGIVAILPFFFVAEAGLASFFASFVLIFVCIIFLGIFLGKISKESIIKNIIQMVGAFILTIVITILILGI